jgi:hypothetical protein
VVRQLSWVVIPSIIIVCVAVAAEQKFGPPQLRCASAAIFLTMPVALLTLWLVRREQVRRPNVAIMLILAGSLARMMLALGGGLIVFLGTDWCRSGGVSFWFWLIAAYLSTLTAEVFVLAKAGWRGVS